MDTIIVFNNHNLKKLELHPAPQAPPRNRPVQRIQTPGARVGRTTPL